MSRNTGDMLVEPMGYLQLSAPQQLAVLAGLLRAVAGDLAEVSLAVCVM